MNKMNIYTTYSLAKIKIIVGTMAHLHKRNNQKNVHTVSGWRDFNFDRLPFVDHNRRQTHFRQ